MELKLNEKRKKRMIKGKIWLNTFPADTPLKKIYKLYRKKYNLPPDVAVLELIHMGYPFTEEYYLNIHKSYVAMIEAKKRIIVERKKQMEDDEDSDETFYYIAGYTAGGFPYGITWEEYYKSQDVQKENEVIDDDDDVW